MARHNLLYVCFIHVVLISKMCIVECREMAGHTNTCVSSTFSMHRANLLPVSPPRDLNPASDDGCLPSSLIHPPLSRIFNHPRTSGLLSHSGIDGQYRYRTVSKDIYLSSVLKHIFGVFFVFICMHLTSTPVLLTKRMPFFSLSENNRSASSHHVAPWRVGELFICYFHYFLKSYLLFSLNFGVRYSIFKDHQLTCLTYSPKWFSLTTWPIHQRRLTVLPHRRAISPSVNSAIQTVHVCM